MTTQQALKTQNLLRALRTISQWAEMRTEGDDRVIVEWGAIHTNGDRERAIGYYVVEPNGSAVKYVTP